MCNMIFFHNGNEENGYLSNWYYSPFTIDDITFSSGEKYMMYMKAMLFNDTHCAELILKTHDFSEIKRLGRSVHGFNDETWDKYKLDIMYKGLYQKFKQNSILAAQLKSTGNSILAECAVKDKIWAIGLSMTDPRRFDMNQWRGQNLLGQVLMQVRDNL